MIHQTADLSLKNLSVERNSQRLFQKLSLDCQLGQAWQIIGPNGSGKSSLLNVLAGLTTPHRGRVLWHNQPLLSYHSLYLSHALNLKAQLTVRENLTIFLYLQAIPSIKTLSEVLTDFELESLQHRLINTLSAGQKCRVNLAKLGLSSVKLWLLDEPFTALDQNQCQKLLARIEHFVKHQGLVLFTSHQAVLFNHLQCHYVYLESL